MTMAWGARVSPEFRTRVIRMAGHLGSNPDNHMACMAWETGRKFTPNVVNGAGSGAIGLIQFMPQTATSLGTSTERLGAMSAVEQLDYVEMFFNPWRGKLHTLEDMYMAILWPSAISKPLWYVLFDRRDSLHPKRYMQNAGLDFNHDGVVTKAEACAKVREQLLLGLKPENAA